MTDNVLIYLVYPLVLAAIIGIFGLLYALFANLLNRIDHHSTTLHMHHYRIAHIESISGQHITPPHKPYGPHNQNHD